MKAPDAITRKWVRSEQDEAAVQEGCRFDERRGLRVMQFCEHFLRHFEGRFAGQPVKWLPWQRDRIVMPLFSWVRPDGLRRFRTCSVWVPKKNGKTTMCSAFIIIGLIGDGEPAAECYGAAVTREQAGQIYRKASAMVKASGKLAKRLKLLDSRKRIIHEPSDSFFWALSSDAAANEGWNTSTLVRDELHAWKDKHRPFHEALEFSGAARDQPLFFDISTAGDNMDSIGYDVYDYARQVRDGAVIDTSFLSVIFEADRDCDPGDEAQWAKANPSLGQTIKVEDFRRDWRKAKASGARAVRNFKRYKLNIWVADVQQWLEPDKWKACTGRDIQPEDLVGMHCSAGLDLALKNDSTALVRCFKLDGFYALLAEFFLPEDVAKLKERQDRGARYTAWARDGYYTLTPGNVTDFAAIKQRILDLHAITPFNQVAFDPFRAQQLTQDLAEAGLPMVEFRQSYLAMSEPIQDLDRHIEGRMIEHFDNPVLTWQMLNAVVKTDTSGNVKLDKSNPRKKIDGAIGSVMAFARERLAAEGGSVYDSGESIWL